MFYSGSHPLQSCPITLARVTDRWSTYMTCKGVIFALELGLLPLKEKTVVRQRIDAAGGNISAIVNAKVHVLITTAATLATGSYKITSAKNLGVPIFLLDELDEVLAFPPKPRTSPSKATSALNPPTRASGILIDWQLPIDFPDLPASGNDDCPMTPTSSKELFDSIDAPLGPLFDYTEETPSSAGLTSPIASSSAVHPAQQQQQRAKDDESEFCDFLFGQLEVDDFSSSPNGGASMRPPLVHPSPVRPSLVRPLPVRPCASPDTMQGRTMDLIKKLHIDLMNEPEAPIFNTPVDYDAMGLPDYPLIIKRPMDLGTISKNLNNGVYRTIVDWAEDVRTVWNNARIYNAPESEVYRSAERLSQLMEARYANIQLDIPNQRPSEGKPPVMPSTALNLKKKIQIQAPTSSPARTTSEAMAARKAKYDALFAKSPSVLTVTPILPPMPSFTSLGFDLKPSTILTPSKTPSKTQPQLRSRATHKTDINSTPIEFQTLSDLIRVDDQSNNNNLNHHIKDENNTPNDSSRSTSLQSSLSFGQVASVGTHLDGEFDELSSPSSAASDGGAIGTATETLRGSVSESNNDVNIAVDEDHDVYDGDNLNDDDDDDDDDLEFDEPRVSGKQHPRGLPKGPHLYVDRCTGVVWKRKSDKRSPVAGTVKLVLNYGKGVRKVWNEEEEAVTSASHSHKRASKPKVKIISKTVCAISDQSQPTSKKDSAETPAPASRPNGATLVGLTKELIEEWYPALPKDPSLPTVAKHIFTGVVNPKFSWVDITTGKASTTKRIPAMDGLKIFVSGISFDDIKLRGEPRDKQFPSYKEAYLKKVKEKNHKAMRLLKKKQRKAALQAATADEDGTLHEVRPKPVPKSVGIKPMKTDEQLLAEIDVWHPNTIALAIQQRKAMITSIFRRFGDVTDFKPDWDKGFIHVTYKNPQSAKSAVKSLSDFSTRAAVIRSLSESFPTFRKEHYPSPSFYVRWTTCYQRKLTRKAKEIADAKQTKMDAAAAKHATEAANAAASVSNARKKTKSRQ